MADTNDVKALQHLSFTIGRTDYGVPILAVKEILPFEESTRVPGTPQSIRGVINVRGQVVPIVDLAVKFGHGETVASNRTCILVVEAKTGSERITVGMLADAVNEVLDLPVSDVEEAPSFGTDVQLDYLTGMGKVGKRFVLLLDVDRVLTASEAAVAAQVAASGEASGTPLVTAATSVG